MYYRLKSSADFTRIYKAGKKGYSNALMMLYTPSDKLKMGISVGKKYGGSVQRNRVKRLFRAAFYELSADINKNIKIVFIPKTGYDHTFENVKKNMLFVLKKEGLIKDA